VSVKNNYLVPSLEHNFHFEPALLMASWFAVRTRSRHEKAVAARLSVQGIENILPLYSTVHAWKDRKQVVQLPLFAGYLFVHIPVQHSLKVLTTYGVAEILGTAGQPVPLQATEINFIQSCRDFGKQLQPHPFLKIGQRVRVRAGAFKNVEGILVQFNNGFRVVVNVPMIQSAASLEIGIEDVVAA
jgi:transcription antitermination factor NusG